MVVQCIHPRLNFCSQGPYASSSLQVEDANNVDLISSQESFLPCDGLSQPTEVRILSWWLSLSAMFYYAE